MKKEIWKSINGFQKKYSISNTGKVMSINVKNKKSYLNKATGYIVQSLIDNGKIKTCTVHRLMAKAFIPNPQNKPEVNHINGIKTDNRVENLEWVTRKENVLHSWKIGTSRITKKWAEASAERAKKRGGKKHPCAKKVIDIVTKKVYYSAKHASQEIGINKNTLYSYLLGNKKNKTNLQYITPTPEG